MERPPTKEDVNAQLSYPEGYDAKTAEEYMRQQDIYFSEKVPEDIATVAIAERITKLREQRPINTIVDIGCGANSMYMKTWLDASGAKKLIGIEPSQDMRSAAAQELEKEPSGTVDIIDGSWFNTNLKSEVADLVVGRFSLHHVNDLSRAFTELARILTPGGQAIVAVPHPLACKKELETKNILPTEGKLMEVTLFDTLQIQYFYHTTDSYLFTHLQENNLELVEHESLRWDTSSKGKAEEPNLLIFTLQKKRS